MEQLAAAVDRLAGQDLSDRDGAELGAELLVFRRLIDRLEAEWLRRAAAFDVSGAWHVDGAASAAAWVAARRPVTDAAAVRAGIAAVVGLESLPAAAAALAAGDIGVGHARQIAALAGDAVNRGARGMDGPLIDPADEAALVEAAKATDARGLRPVVQRFREAADEAAGVKAARLAHARRSLRTWTRAGDGMLCLAGEFAPDAGALVATALEAVRRQGRAEKDPRTPDQQRADAMVGLCKAFLDGDSADAQGGTASPGPGSGERAHVSVIIDLEALLGRPGAGGGFLGDGETICSETARRICCDAAVSRVLTGPGPAILEFGRSRRTASRSQRRYLEVRDGGCVFPHCGKPSTWCDAHHLIFWADHDHPGDTDVGNLALVCWDHHVAVHEGGWNLHRLPDGAGWQASRGGVTHTWAGPPQRHGGHARRNGPVPAPGGGLTGPGAAGEGAAGGGASGPSGAGGGTAGGVASSGGTAGGGTSGGGTAGGGASGGSREEPDGTGGPGPPARRRRVGGDVSRPPGRRTAAGRGTGPPGKHRARSAGHRTGGEPPPGTPGSEPDEARHVGEARPPPSLFG